MKTIRQTVLASLILISVVLSLIFGCTTSQQTTAYQTLYGLETGVTAAYSGYTSLVIKGSVSTNQVPTISHAFNDFQAAMLPALDAVQFSTNALAPASLVTEGNDVMNLILVAEGK